MREVLAKMGSLGYAMARRKVSLAVIGVFVSILTVSPRFVWAQMNFGTILGTVTDASGAAIPGAKITITNMGTRTSQTFVTGSTGDYVVPTLIPGTYEVSAEKEGFRTTIRSGIALDVDQKARVDLSLQVGSITQSVEVTGQAPLVQSESSEISQVIHASQIVELPLNVRNFTQLVALNTGTLPGYEGLSPDNPQGTSYMTVNGISYGGNNWQIDGVTDNEAFFSIISVNPSIDAIGEFKIATNDYAAEYGRAGGANVQISIKSGTNAFHGDAFEFVRNSALDSSDFFTNESGGKIVPYRQNQFGANLGGPIKKDRTFFFADYEGFRSRTGATELQVIPTMLQRQGNFTEAGNPVIYNPNDLVNGVPQPFPGNIITSDLITTPAANVMGLLPTPNLTPATIGDPDFANSNSTAHDTNSIDGRIDHQLSEKDQLLVRYSFLQTFLDTPPFLGATIGGDPYLSSLANTRNQNAVISETHTFNPHMINEFRVGLNRVRTDWTAYDVNLKTSDQVGIPGINDFCGFCGGLARIQIAGFNSYGATPYAPTYRHDTIFQYVDNLTVIHGRHTIKTGADIRRIQADLFQTADTVGEFDFDQRFTSNLGAAGTGSGLASFLLGNYESAERDAMTDYPSNRGDQIFFFGQDDFKINDKLTLNLGLRYELYTAPTDAHNNLSNFDFATGNILLACIATSCSAGVKTQKNLWEPRVGFAYSPDRGKTAIRSSFGSSAFSPGWGGQIGTLNDNFPFVQGQSLIPANTLTISPTDPVLSEGLPALPSVETRPGAPAGTLIPTGGNVFEQDPNLKMENTYQWTFNIQRTVTPNLVLSAAYVGNMSENIFINLPGNYPQVGAATATGLPLQELRPYYSVDPGLQGITVRTNAARSHYNSLQLKLERRTSYGLSFLVGYTIAKEMDRGEDWTDPNNYMAAKEIDSADIPQRLVASYTYALPFGRQNRHWGKSWNRVTDSFLGGWQVSGITTYMSGYIFNPSITSNLDNGNGDVPNRICSGYLAHRTISEWFDPNCFVPAPTNVFGNMGYNILRGPGFRNWDVGVEKNFNFTESKYLQFRGEFFNMPNNVNFGTPNSSICTGCDAGVITGLASGYTPREVQFALKLYF